jgi:hypothetical protein
MAESSPIKHVDNEPIETAPAEIVPIKREPLSVAEMRTQVDHIQQIMKAVMKNNEHYGTIPGCGNKPTLLKPGAEKLGMVFRLIPEYAIEEKELDGGHREYMVTTKLYHAATGELAGSGVGMCSTPEKKYKSRPPSDMMNTVLKMAKKRSHVDAILTATAASDIFTQDIEDGGNGSAHDNERMGALEKLGFELAEWCIEHVSDEGALAKFKTAFVKRIKILGADRAAVVGALYKSKENEFQE